MNKRIKSRWLRALRSGKYRQNTGCLKDIDHEGNAYFCCLGVLCDLHSKSTKTPWGRGDTYLSLRGVLPSEVVDWAELSGNNPYNPHVVYQERDSSLMNLNDENALSFEQIANVIEKQL